MWLALAVLALYRAVLFIHEITHLPGRELPFFTGTWNVLVGVPLLIPSFLYENVHTDHHRQRCYGTTADPEYVPYGRRSPALLAGSVILSLLVPVAFIIRFGLLAPIGWLLPAVRRAVSTHASALVINHHYVRKAPITVAGRIEEAAATLFIYVAGTLWLTGRIGSGWVVNWLIAGALISGINAVRTLAAHRYDIDEGDEVSMTSQLLDSCTIAPIGMANRMTSTASGALHALLAPVGLRYHALHHWIPKLPYHNLGRAHRQLIAALNADAPYQQTIHRTASSAIADLVRRSRASRRERSSSTP